MMNVLIVRTSSMGDLIHTWPAITELVKHYPNLRLSWLAEENFADIARLHPAVQTVFPFAWRRWRKQICSPSTWREMRQLKQALQSVQWDLVIDSQGLLKSAIPARLSGGPLAGYDWQSVREPLASLLYNKRFRVSRQQSAVERNRALFSSAFGYAVQGSPVFGILPGERPAWLPAGRYAMLLHATSRASKEWPESCWQALAQRLQQQYGLAVVYPWGNETERQRAERLASGADYAMAAPRMTLEQAAAALGHAAAVVGVDTGLSHLANALDVPLVALYTDTDPALTGVCETDYAINLGGIGQMPTVDEVMQALISRRGFQ
ncbi:lipopolysaccharide heptosyltransferase I [Paludibacterium sp. THUN1379]|uniref:lipopolysaccharide heptosyltransferase I n=1 Tax=Paludibacterium sp. THUN1379 TaxID=3112107 RepID=UPI0030CB31A1